MATSVRQLHVVVPDESRLNSNPSFRQKRKKTPKVSRKFRKVFVDNLSRETTDETIYDHFSVYGAIEEVAKFEHRADPNKFYAFVVFEEANSCLLATQHPSPKIGNDIAYCALAAIGEQYSGFQYFKKMNMLTDPNSSASQYRNNSNSYPRHDKQRNRVLQSRKAGADRVYPNQYSAPSTPTPIHTPSSDSHIEPALTPTSSVRYSPEDKNKITSFSPEIFDRRSLRIRINKTTRVQTSPKVLSPSHTPHGSLPSPASVRSTRSSFASTSSTGAYYDDISQQSPFSASQSPYFLSAPTQCFGFGHSPPLHSRSERNPYYNSEYGSRTPQYTPGGSVTLLPRPRVDHRYAICTPPAIWDNEDGELPYFQPLEPQELPSHGPPPM